MSLTTPRPTQAERRARTQAALLAAARDLFAEQGYARTGREDIARRAGVTRGALYHHFASKADVFGAVVVELENELVDRVVAAALTTDDALERLQRACRAYIDAAAEPAVAQILLTDAPAVLGVARCREITATSCLRLLDQALAHEDDDGLAVPGDLEVAASLLLGMMNEAAAVVATAPDPDLARGPVGATIDAFLVKLLS